jgi:ankyrin repeat protein
MSTWEQYKETMAQPITLWSAAKTNDVGQLIRLLDAGADIDAGDGRGYAPLMLAAYAGHAAAVELLLGRGANPDSRDHAGNSVLMGVAWKGNLALVQRLLEAGADPTARNQHGIDVRGFAATFGRHEVVALIDAFIQSKGEDA